MLYYVPQCIWVTYKNIQAVHFITLLNQLTGKPHCSALQLKLPISDLLVFLPLLLSHSSQMLNYLASHRWTKFLTDCDSKLVACFLFELKQKFSIEHFALLHWTYNENTTWLSLRIRNHVLCTLNSHIKSIYVVIISKSVFKSSYVKTIVSTVLS